MENLEKKEADSFTMAPLEEVVKALRGPEGCPWDKVQTHSTLRRYLLEEVYEMLEAIDNKDMVNLREELGDVLLQVIFHCRLAEEAGYFTVQDVIDDITNKMIRRHPHVFEQQNVDDLAEIVVNWEEIKAKEKGNSRKSILDGISKGLPALLRAQKLQEKAAKVGFDWDSVDPVWDKLEEELGEFKAATIENERESSEENRKNLELEAGDVLFSLINLFKWYKISGENALNRTNNKFIARFQYVEAAVNRSGKDWNDFSLDELDQFWNEAKEQE